jgi:hypothetical protein
MALGLLSGHSIAIGPNGIAGNVGAHSEQSEAVKFGELNNNGQTQVES